ncbi:esterase-like activity of phytase family protein [Desulfovibrio aerotolerans]|uniref:Esterase-like activity of phytase family protein n=1 Tax=Solidesulfovibrio aerotolerans TaxID=295255 RepID=A0A7C9INC9_9BACT|nr:esterase-like activity of phytase family protein [Solidesulfovibrio aerotolerans]MYL84146.1 esterase-like activity of phytase family protein [Solidesulfovibrio aerotolerans]
MTRRFAPAALAVFLAAAPASAAEAPTVKKYVIEAPKSANIPAPAALAAAFPDGFPLGLGSGVAYAGRDADGSLLLYAVGDRGPNADGPGFLPAPGAKAVAAKFFPAPNYVPSLAKLRLKGDVVEVLAVTPLSNTDGTPVSGRPLPAGAVGSTGETGLGSDLAVLPTDANGLDPEGIAVDPTDGNLWLCDEYGPFLVKVEAATGKILKKYAPGQGLPDILAKRQPNRGFEGVAVAPDGKVYAAMQSILDVDGKVKASKAPFLRLLELDPATGATRMFAYPHDVAVYKKSGDAKLGDLTAIAPGKFVTVEQAKGADKVMRNVVYTVDLTKATDLSGKTAPDGQPLETLADLAALEALGVVPAAKTRLFDLRDLGWKAEKAEGLALLPDGKTLVVASDNDFGLAGTVVNPATDKDGKPVTDPTDYTLAPDGQAGYDGKPVPTTFAIVPSGEKTELWVVTLPQALK